MAIERLDIEKFLELAKAGPVLDVRSPGEFAQAHIPGGYNLPLFTDEERKTVGIAYKRKSREEAIKIGLDYFGLKMRKMVDEVENLVARWPIAEYFANTMADEPSQTARGPWGQSEENASQATTGSSRERSGKFVPVLVHCWRGGMRSTAIAWLLDLYGFKVYLLEGGYKKFRNYVLETFKTPFNCKILGGFTGSGKTTILHELSAKRLTVIDLEGLANHKGSAFGTIGCQPSQEMFENMLALKLRGSCAAKSFSASDNDVWLEDESQRIGAVIIPPDFWKQMCHASIFFLQIPFEERLENIVHEYGGENTEALISAILRIQKRLGGFETKKAIYFLKENNKIESFRILLAYYDKCYSKSLQRKPGTNTVKNISFTTVNKKENASQLIKAIGGKELTY